MLLIHGTWRPGQGEAFEARNPATGEIHWRGTAANEADIAEALTSARAGFAVWRKLSLDDRLAFCRRYAERVKAREADLVQAIIDDAAKPRWEAKTEAAAIAAKVEISVKAHAVRTGTTVNDGAERQVLRHKPHGVVAVFGPYNFPGHLANGHIVPALIAGNAVILKPSELTPRTGELMAELWLEAGLPAGVLNLVQGGRETGAALAAAELDGLFFTGSEATGRHLHRAAAGNLHRILALELGGNNPLIAWEIGDVAATALEIAYSAYITAGQRCTCARRLIIEKGTAGDKIIEALQDLIPRLGVGMPDDEPFMGPVISARAAQGLMAAQEALIAKGAKPLVAMTRPDPQGAFLTPGLIDVTDVERNDEELFGPFLQVIRVSDFDAALDEANNTRFGLAAGLFTANLDLWPQFADEIRAGIVNLNRQTTGASSAAPFGGVGASGNHRPAAYYAADYCAFPMASLERDALTMPATLLPGIRP